MADDTNEDSWLYGTSNPDSTTNEEERGNDSVVEEAGFEKDSLQQLTSKSENEALAAVIQGDDVNVLADTDCPPADAELVEFEDPAHEMEEDEEATAAATVADTTEEGEREEGEEKTKEDSEPGADDDDDDDDDDSDDDINVVIGDIKAAPSTYNIKQRSNLLAGSSGQEKSKSAAQVGKFSIEDFEGVGSINGVAAHEFSIDSLEDKPWRKPGADITDYFNYGFNEETWRAYCERQKRFRVVESGVGLASLTQNLNPPAEKMGEGNVPLGHQMGPLPPGHTPPGHSGEHIQMPPPGMMPPPGSHQGPPPRYGIPRGGPRPMPPIPGSKENAIQVMTAECREYSRPGQMPPNFGGPVGGEEVFFHEPEPFDYGYEPTQDSQWGNENPNWVPTGIKELTPGPNTGPPPQMAGPPGMMPNQMGVPPPMGAPPPQMRHQHPQPTMMGNMPPPNIGMVPPPIGMMMGPGGPGGPPMRMPMGPPRIMGPNGPPPDRLEDDRERRRREREWERERDRDRSRRERSRSREKSRRRSKSREKEREKDRDKERDKERDRDRDRERERDRDRDRERPEKDVDNERSDEERERRRKDRDRDRERERENRDRERSSRRERSRSREKSRRRSKSREKERDRSSKTAAVPTTATSSSRSDKKKSHRKEEEE